MATSHPRNEREALLQLHAQQVAQDDRRELNRAIRTVVRHNADTVRRADQAVNHAAGATLAFILAALAALALLHFLTPCDAGMLCAALLGVPDTRPADADTGGTDTHCRVRPLPLPWFEERIRAAAAEAGEQGERIGYLAGTRNGIGVGLAWGLLAGILIGVAAVKLGLGA